MSKNLIFPSIIISSLLITRFSNTNLFAESIDYQTEITPIGNSLGIEKSTIQRISLQITNFYVDLFKEQFKIMSLTILS